MKKAFALITAFLLACMCAVGIAETLEFPEEKTSQEEAAYTPLTPTDIALLGRPMSDTPTHITVGNTTAVSGYFFTDLWSNNTSDIDVRTLLHGYQTVVWDSQTEFVIDPIVIQSLETKKARAGTEYVITLQKDLTYSDGQTPITAKDYVFSLLLTCSPQIKELGATSAPYSHLVGYEEYESGEKTNFAGVRLLDEFTFSLTVKKSFEPYFYELASIRVLPYPITELAPYCEVADDGKGAYLRSVDPNEAEAPFTAEVLRKTIFDEETGYMHAPKLTSGPYLLTGYDPESGRVDFALNPYYKGNYEGVKPIIDTLALVPVSTDTMLTQLESGEVDVLNKCVDSSVITQGMGMMSNGVAMTSYARIGYGFCAFACEQGPQQFQAVRQAIAYSFDADAFITEYLGGFGVAVYGSYGIGQWMLSAAQGALRPEDATPAEVKKWESLSLEGLNLYAPDAAEALRLLEKDGWTLNEQGETFDLERDKVRYKKVDDELMRLSLRFAKAQGNEGAEMVVNQLEQTLPPLGMELLVEEVPFTELLADYYREDGQRKFDMNFMATNFSAAYDPYFAYVTDETVQGAVNTSGLRDKKLMELAWDLHKTEPMQFLEYETKWIALQERINELLPTMPIYSNVYFDFYTNWLQNYTPNSAYSWPMAILYAYYAEPQAQEIPGLILGGDVMDDSLTDNAMDDSLTDDEMGNETFDGGDIMIFE